MFLLVLLLFMPLSAHAYLDPGTGSFLIQILVGVVAGGAYLVKTFWKNIRSFFSRKQQDNPNSTNETDKGNS